MAAQEGRFDLRTGVGMPLGAPATIVPCKDGHVWMLALERGQWEGLRKVMGDPEWARLEMFNDMYVRAQNADIMYSFIEEWTAQHTKAEIMEKCQAAGCPITAVFTIEEAAGLPHLKARDFFVDIDHPDLGRIRNLGAPFKMPASPGGPTRPSPRLGEHNDEVYGQLCSLPAAWIAALRDRAVI
jgi:crotonobetainyl-CoA:carnitine CoA-transferase CaiB-like acyl-CoA transferase